MTTETIATVDEIPEGEGIGVQVDGVDIAVFNVDGDFRAVSNRCPHKSASLCEAGEEKLNSEDCTAPTRGRVENGDNGPTLYCPWHWWEWDLGSGEHPHSDMGLRTFPVSVEDDQVRVEV